MSFFGQTSAAPTATGFGSTPSTGFNTAPKPGGFTFGGGGTTSSATTTPSLFGSTSTTTPSFGLSTATSQPQQQATTGFGSTNTFGGLSTQTSTAPTSSTTTPSLFGGASTTTPSFGLSTATSQPQQQATTGFGSTNAFGGLSTQTSTAPTSSTTTPSLFGSTTSTTPFGGTKNLFGGTPSTTATTNTSTSLFGGNTSANTSSGLFGSTANKPSTSFGFSTGSFGTNLQGTNNMTPQQRDKMIYELLVQKEREDWQQRGQRGLSDVTPENIWQSMALMKSWWDPDSPNCRFKTYFYNMVPTQEVHLYQRPPNQDQKAWEDAQKKNPDPTCMVPTLAIGFGDIQKRMEVQSQQSQAHKSKLLEIDEKIKKMKESTLRDNATKLMEAKRQYMEITQRVIKFLKHTQVLRQKGLSITPEEEMMRTRFQSIQDQLQQSEQFHGTLSQMWAQLQLIKESGRKYGSIGGVDEWDSVSSSHVEEITKILDEQQRGIQHTIEVLECDTKDVNTLLQQQRQLQLQDRLQHLR